MSRRNLNVSGPINTPLPWLLGIAGAAVAHLFFPTQVFLAGLLGLSFGVISGEIAKRKVGPASYEPADITPDEKQRLLLVTKLLVLGGGVALLLAGQLIPQASYDAWSSIIAWHPLSGEVPRALMTYLGGFALGIGFALPVRPKVTP